jgi:hypothetical protein
LRARGAAGCQQRSDDQEEDAIKAHDTPPRGDGCGVRAV